MKHDPSTAQKKGVSESGRYPGGNCDIYFDSPILEDLEVSYHFQTNPSAALQPWKLFKSARQVRSLQAAIEAFAQCQALQLWPFHFIQGQVEVVSQG